MRIPRLTPSLCSLLILLAATSCRSNSSRQPVGATTTDRGATLAPPQPNPDRTDATARPDRRTMTDPEITAAVVRELAEDGAVDVTKLHVKTTNGIVEITGTVDNVLAKELATRYGEVVKGVRAVTNRIVVDGPRLPDGELADKVATALRADPTSSVTALRVDAKDGVVKLSGKVSSFQQRLFAERVAKRTRGVSDVDNQLDVQWKFRRSDAEIARDVAARLRWDVLVDHGMIGIDVRDNKVQLTGVVGSAAEKTHAERDAWVAGVQAVDASALRVDPWSGDDRLRHEKYVIKSGAEVSRAINDALSYDPRVNTLDVRATASGGVATLSGSVPSVAARRAAEDIAMHTVGVLSINNYLEVKPPKVVADVELEKKVVAALRAHPYTDDHEVRVVAERGKVTLDGAVDSTFERAEAESVAAETAGVRAIDNRLVVEKQRTPYVYRPYAYPYYPQAPTPYSGPPYPGKPDAEIAKDIRDQLYWSPFIREERVEVSVRNGKATLSGIVDNIREKRSAVDAAFEAGAVSVDNQLAVR